jgi:large subunit ribosomal protein L21
MQAIIAESGKQYFVKPGDVIEVDWREVEPGAQIEFDRVLMVTGEGAKYAFGHPYIAGAKVVGSVVGDVRGKKIHIGKYKRRKNYRLHKGHRQTFTSVEVKEIVGGGV